jgi:hypothetical protein
MRTGGPRNDALAGGRKYGNANDVCLNSAGQAQYATASPGLKALFDRIHDGVVERVQCEVRSTRQDNTLNLKTGGKISVALTVEPGPQRVRIDVMVVSTGNVAWETAADELAKYRSMLVDPSQPAAGPGRSLPWYWHYKASRCEEIRLAVELIVTALRHWEKV